MEKSIHSLKRDYHEDQKTIIFPVTSPRSSSSEDSSSEEDSETDDPGGGNRLDPQDEDTLEEEAVQYHHRDAEFPIKRSGYGSLQRIPPRSKRSKSKKRKPPCPQPLGLIGVAREAEARGDLSFSACFPVKEEWDEPTWEPLPYKILRVKISLHSIWS